MKLRDVSIEPGYVGEDETPGVSITSNSIELCACGGTGNEAKAFIPVEILNQAGGVNPHVAAVEEMRVSSDTQSNSRGVRRVMVKVELPYQSLPEADVAAQGGVIDTRRSGQTISAHIVVSVPRAAAEDLTGSRGPAAQKAALAQVRGVCSLLLAVASPEMAGSFAWQSVGIAAITSTLSSAKIPADGDYLVETPTLYASNRVNHGRVEIKSNALNGQPGISFAGLANDPLNAYDPLWRGLLGQRPIACEQEIILPTAAVAIPSSEE